MDAVLSRDIDSFIAENEAKLFEDIARLVAIPSVEEPAEPGMPFGKGPAAALEKGLEIAQELGLEAVNLQNYIGYAKIGSSDKYLATITHLDIVPTGDGWSADPFTMRERDGWIMGRGVMDDKGPSVLCLYALKYLKERNIPLKYEVRALLGANEETGMKDVTWYLENYPAPAFCFSPDADFPLINGEKGIYHGKIVSKPVLENILEMKGGFVSNAVPDKASALVKAAALADDGRVTVEAAGEGLWRVNATGLGGHAAMPQGTVNAIGVLVKYLLKNKVCSGKEEQLLRFLDAFHSSWDGSGIGCDADDGLFDPLTIVGGIISTENGCLVQTVDSRFPTNTNGTQIAAAIKAAAGDVADIIGGREVAPMYLSLDNPALQACINAYNEVTGENAKPYTIGGGTYAKDFPNAVSFGPEHPERPAPDFAGPIHGVDEAACKAWFLEALKVYIVALLELEKLDF